LLVIPHFKNLVGQPEDFIYNHTLDVQLGSPAFSKSIYLAYEEGDGGEGTVGVVTVRFHVPSLPNVTKVYCISFRAPLCSSLHYPISHRTIR
jgi:hypothetical protein